MSKKKLLLFFIKNDVFLFFSFYIEQPYEKQWQQKNKKKIKNEDK